MVKDAVENAKTMVENSLGLQGLDGVCTFSPLLLGNYLLGYTFSGSAKLAVSKISSPIQEFTAR